MISFKIKQEIYNKAFASTKENLLQAVQSLQNKTGVGNDYLGWMDLPLTCSDALLHDITATARRLQSNSDVVIVTGIGGSYLGSRAVISALNTDFHLPKPDIIYAGHHLSEDYYACLLRYLNTVDYSIIVISKSGTTTETAVAFRLLKEHCEQKYGSGKTGDRIVCITDGKESVLRTTAQKEGYTTYEIPPDVGGRYSVLSPVGLLPIAVGGFDVFALLEGAKTMRQQLLNTQDNIAFRYAAVRNYLLQQGRNIEVLSVFEPKLYYMTEWWKQLFGESEGKAGKGIFPVGMTFSTDLHSLGQYMQEGQRIMFETFLSIARSKEECRIPFANDNEDGLNFLANKRIGELNNTVEKATMLAHRQGDVPVMQITMDTLDEKNTGELIYFFEYACAISAYMLGVNPFNQSGVDTYKENMFALLEKPGYEQKNKQLRENLSDI